jgi:hypothetical protein
MRRLALAFRPSRVPEGGLILNRLIGWALLAFVVYYLVTSPEGAAGFIHSSLDVLRNAGDSLARFVNKL